MNELLLEFTRDLFKIPSHQNKDGTENSRYHEQLRWWSMKIAAGVSMTFIGLVLTTAMSYGLLFGDGFARAEGTKNIEAELIAEKLEKVETALCMNRGDEQLLARRRELQSRYRMVNKGEPYDIPECSLLLKILPASGATPQ